MAVHRTTPAQTVDRGRYDTAVVVSGDGVLHIDRRMLRRAQLPQKVVSPEGTVPERPRYWS
jgi:hypothetical protein